MLKICLKFTNYHLRTGQILPNKIFGPADWDPKQQFWDPKYEKLGPTNWDPKQQTWDPNRKIVGTQNDKVGPR
jgi:hypothetical protein